MAGTVQNSEVLRSGASGRSLWRRLFGPRRHYHIGPPAIVYVGVTLLLAMGAFNSQNNLLFWALGFAFAALIVSGLMSGRMLMGLTVQRRSLPPAHAGDTVTVHHRVRNNHRRAPAYALTVEELSLSVPTRREIARSRNSLRAVLESPGFIQHVAPAQSETCGLRIHCLSRGPFELRTVRISTAFPFGLVRKSVEFDQPVRLLIRPRLLALPTGMIRDLLQSGLGNLTTSRRMGTGDEFFALREYVEGDSPRAIAWKASAHRMALGSPNGLDLLVRQNSTPSPIRVWMVVRFAGSTDRGEQESAISVTASLAREAITRGMAVGLCVPACEVILRPGGGPAHLDRIFDELAMLTLPKLETPGKADGFPRAVHSRSGMCIVVHAGEADRGYAPDGTASWISHISAKPFATAQEAVAQGEVHSTHSQANK